MNTCITYIYSVFAAFVSLGKGMFRTFSSLIHPKRILTQQYPENRETTLYVPERFQGELALIVNEDGTPKCTACTLCQTACPNDTIQLRVEKVTTEDGKSKRILSQYIYDLGRCTFCGQCVDSCNFGAIEFSNHFENSEYDKRKLIRRLNENPTIRKEKQV